MTLPHSQQVLYTAVAKAVQASKKQLIVVLVSAGGIDVDETVVSRKARRSGVAFGPSLTDCLWMQADAVLWQPCKFTSNGSPITITKPMFLTGCLWLADGGQASGDGLVSVLFGDYNPTARLPETFYKQAWADGMANSTAKSILSFDLEVGLGRTHR